MVTSRQQLNNINLIINDQAVKRVSIFKYLGATLNEKWDCDEVKIRIETAKTTS